MPAHAVNVLHARNKKFRELESFIMGVFMPVLCSRGRHYLYLSRVFAI
jgi:hypothetical protein